MATLGHKIISPTSLSPEMIEERRQTPTIVVRLRSLILQFAAGVEKQRQTPGYTDGKSTQCGFRLLRAVADRMSHTCHMRTAEDHKR